ncbi:type VII secretion protein EccB [Streptomyces chartreusis]|uniref:type VII secretion protein EccB n=1 Tax=Streptomyces chartreusis TaxID=1969 RepID=UPI00382C0446
MQSRRDQVQAYSFTVERLTTSMLAADPDLIETPMGRTRRGTAIGLVIALLLCVGYTVYGLLFSSGSNAWSKPGTLIVEKDTGARYLYGGGVLRPVVNYASAKLILGKGGKTEDVSRSTLADVPRGAPIGIPGAPDSLPSADQLTDAAWEVCATSRTDDDGSRRPTTTLGVGITPGDQKALGADEALLVKAAGGDSKDSTDYLLWQGRRLRLDDEHGALQSLGYGTTDPVDVGNAFLAPIPAGADLAPPEVQGRGTQGPTLAGEQRRVGQYFVVHAPGAADQHYLLTGEGLVPLTTTELQLVRGDPRTSKEAYAGKEAVAVELQPNEIREHAAPGHKGAATNDELPTRPPEALAPRTGTVPCLRVIPNGSTPQYAFTQAPAALVTGQAPPARQGIAAGCPAPDLIGARPGGGVLVASTSTGTGISGVRYLVTGDGIKYPLSAASVVEQLSYGDSDLVQLPSALLRLLATGPVLDPERAARPALSGPAAATADPECGGEGKEVSKGAS